MSQFQSISIPPIPTDIKEPAYSKAITTRVMAIKQIKETQTQSSPRGSISERRNSRFLSGTSIPNSTIRSSIDRSKTILLEKPPSVHSPKASNESLDEESKNNNESEERGLERMRKKIRSYALSLEPPTAAREHRRSSSIKAIDTPFSPKKMRRSTIESIRNAIDKSPNYDSKLVNADSIEKRNVGQHFKLLTSDPITPKPQSPQRPQRRVRDLQTQTSLVLEKLLMEMRQNPKP